jgi:glyceraldehyde 3-phosphate dehydrogenase
MNDLGDIKNIAYLLKYDSAYGKSKFDVKVREDNKAFSIDGKEVLFVSEKDPANLPWKDLNIDVVIESTGFFTSFAGARAHIQAGAKRVVISAPAKDDPKDATEGTILMGLNEGDLSVCEVSSNASCTTNAASPLIQILHEAIGIEKAVLSTTHAYTASQSIVDSPAKKDFKEGRAAAHNIVPTSTGAAIAVTKVVKNLTGLFDGISLRVPVIAGSIADVTFIAKRDTTAEEVNDILRKAAQDPRWAKTFTVTDEQLVSSDIVGSSYAAIADLGLTRVIGGNLVKVMSWYDNEMGYTHSLVEHAIQTGSHIKK